jgi:hypothetical protein
MLRYAENLERGAASILGQVEEIAEESKVPWIKMGCALKRVSTSRYRFNEKQKKYLINIFLLGEQTGQKADASDVSKSMRKARNADGSLLFMSNEYLTSQQIISFFSSFPVQPPRNRFKLHQLRVLTSTKTLMTWSPPWQRKSLSKCVKKY